ncbi:MAG: response regulator transcription factor [Actinobacteria bacterium]|nr:MAG: response regulator transcription factor [Actinomycetota bacterium]
MPLTRRSIEQGSDHAARVRLPARSREERAASGTVRVFLCDDVPEFRSLMRFALEEDESIEVVGEAGNGAAGVEGVRATRPDVVLLDLSMPLCDGLEAIPQIRRAAPDCAIVVLSGLRAEPIAPTVLAQGAHAYIGKGESFAGIRRVVRQSATSAP